jgi:sec-independent protein translocase protein TatB
MFDVSWGELLIVGAVALVVIGPEELPRALKTLGVVAGKIRRMADEFRGQFQDAMHEVEASAQSTGLHGTGLYASLENAEQALKSTLNPLDSGSFGETPALNAAQNSIKTQSAIKTSEISLLAPSSSINTEVQTSKVPKPTKKVIATPKVSGAPHLEPKEKISIESENKTTAKIKADSTIKAPSKTKTKPAKDEKPKYKERT